MWGTVLLGDLGPMAGLGLLEVNILAKGILSPSMDHSLTANLSAQFSKFLSFFRLISVTTIFGWAGQKNFRQK